MEINLGLQMDDETAKKIVSTHQSQNHTNTSITNAYSFNGKTLSFLTSKHTRMTKKDLRFNTEHDIDNMNIELTTAEMTLKKFLKLEHNTIDIINENMKLKELAAFIKATYEQDVERLREENELVRKSLADMQTKMDMVGKDLEHRNGENNDLLLTQQKRQKEFDELYLLLEEREREVESANKYSEALLMEKKKLLVIIEQKDKKIEHLAKDLYHKDHQLAHQLEDLNRIIRDLQDEKKDVLDNLRHKNEQVTDLTMRNTALIIELEAANAEYRKAFDAHTRATNSNKEDDLFIKLREIENLRDEHDNLRLLYERLIKDHEELKHLSDEKEKSASVPKRDENLDRDLEAKNHKIENLGQEIHKMKDELDEKEGKINELENQVENMKKSLKRVDDDLADRFHKLHALDDQLHKNNEHIKTLDNKIKDLEAQIELKNREIELQKDENKSFNDKIKEQLNIIAQKDTDLVGADKQKDALEDELEKLRKLNDDLADENMQLKTNRRSFNTNVVHQFDELKNAIAQKDFKVNGTELQLKKLLDSNQELQLENGKLKKQIDDLKRKIKDLDDLLDIKEKDNKELRDDNVALSNDLEETIKDNTDLQTKFKNLDDAYKLLKADDKAKQKLTDLEAQVNANLYKIVKGIIKLKVRAADVNSIVGDTETVDQSVEEAIIQKLSEDQYVEAALRLITETEGILNEAVDDAESIRKSLHNLQVEKLKLTEIAQALEEKYADIRQRHDYKTDLIGKMSVKIFVLSAELERILVK